MQEDILKEQIERSCNRHLRGDLSIEEFQWELRNIENSITSIEYNEIRTYLAENEGELELILYTEEPFIQTRLSYRLAMNVVKWLNQRKIQEKQIDHTK